MHKFRKRNNTAICGSAPCRRTALDILSNGSYAVIHYGTGKGGTKGAGGEVAFIQISGNGFVTFPATGSGPNGKGGISSIDLFKCEGDHDVPDRGATVMLLGSALTGLGLVQRYLKR